MGCGVFFFFFYTYSKVYSNSVMFIYSHTVLFLCFFFFSHFIKPLPVTQNEVIRSNPSFQLMALYIDTHPLGLCYFSIHCSISVFAMREPKYRFLYLVLLALKHLSKIMLTSPLWKSFTGRANEGENWEQKKLFIPLYCIFSVLFSTQREILISHPPRSVLVILPSSSACGSKISGESPLVLCWDKPPPVSVQMSC